MVKLEVRAQSYPYELLGWIQIPAAYASHSIVAWPLYAGSSEQRAYYGRLELPIREFTDPDNGRKYRAFMTMPGSQDLLLRVPRFTPAA